MSLLRLLAVAIVLLLTSASAVSDASVAQETRAESWRQTREGWQHAEDFLGPAIDYPRAALHPSVVGALEVLLTLTAMLAFSEEGKRREAGIDEASSYPTPR